MYVTGAEVRQDLGVANRVNYEADITGNITLKEAMFLNTIRHPFNLDFLERKVPEIKNVIFNEKATIVFWEDGDKTVVKLQDGDTYNKELGFAMCICKKALGGKGNYNDLFKKWVYEEE